MKTTQWKRYALAALAVMTMGAGMMSPLVATVNAADMTLRHDTKGESPYPPLSENTKKAIAAYQANPNEQTKQGVLDALNEAYDAVVQRKWQNVEKHTAERDKKIASWLKRIEGGKMPPFMELETGDKGSERADIEKAVKKYRQNPTAGNKNTVKQALEAYYDAFIKEQKEHAEETAAQQQTRVAASLAYFTSDMFHPQRQEQARSIAQDDVYAEIIASYIARGAAIVPVNPEDRVQERQHNAAILAARTTYANSGTPAAKDALTSAVDDAFTAVLQARQQDYDTAVKKGQGGGNALFEKLLDPSFRQVQYQEVTEPLNLYGRMDRMVTLGHEALRSQWTPRLQAESRELAVLLQAYDQNPTEANKQAVKAKFDAIYKVMLKDEGTQLDHAQDNFQTMVEKMTDSLTQRQHKRK